MPALLGFLSLGGRSFSSDIKTTDYRASAPEESNPRRSTQRTTKRLPFPCLFQMNPSFTANLTHFFPLPSELKTYNL